MRGALQPRAWLSGLGQAPIAHLRTESLQHICTTSQCLAETEAEVQQLDGSVDGDTLFLQRVTARFKPTVIGSAPPPSRPILANTPAAAELMERAVPQTPTPEPVYDLPTFLENSYPQFGVRPRNPGYDWRRWAAAPGNLRLEPLSGSGGHAPQAEAPAASQPSQSSRGGGSAEAQLALLHSLDAHMALPASRRTITRIAKLELAHLWYYQLQQAAQQHLGPGRGTGALAEVEPEAAAAADAAPRQEAAPAAAGSGAPASVHKGKAAAEVQAAAAAPSAAAAAAAPAAEAGDMDDDIFAAADRKAAAAAAARARKDAAAAATRQHEEIRRAEMDPMSSLPPDLRRRLESALRSGGKVPERMFPLRPGALRDELRNLAAASLHRRLPRDAFAAEGRRVAGLVPEGLAGAERLDWLARKWETWSLSRGPMKQPTAADEALQQQVSSSSPPAHWADVPLMSYVDGLTSIVAARSAVRRAAAEAGPDGAASLRAAVSSLSARSPRPGAHPATPLLALLTDYLAVKYQDLLHAWWAGQGGAGPGTGQG
ncbi:hypothetical protein GPECTOR_55g319 [Gonium pectorale]|uniref:Uncharacterized protein n=1 Tax=Gonium pectorale TaxID=33097 RepID=A0A150G6L5_GONPE|nr:hypothetical protein GPECTOR_55g319 [Gonium pectorale]|eukprot:KXZ45413.1 hypothetical protein GPECTOR_55g319 [Gonium pectorale]